MIKNIIFDLGNVVIPNPKMEVVKQFFKDEKDAQVFNNYIFESKYWEMMDLGKMTNEEVADKIIENKLVDVGNYEEVRNFMMKWFSKRRLNEDVVELGKKLKLNGYKVYILSNMASSTYEYFKEKSNFFGIVDGTVVSAYEGVKKPDNKIFEILLDRYKLDAEECLLIDDDDTNKTLEVANSLGIKCRKVLPNNVQDIKKLLKENDVRI